jgi:hypothetical protein
MFQSPQAITISIFYFIMFLIVAFLAFKSLPFVDALKVLTPFLLTTLLLIYDTDCLVTGGCYVYSWIRTVLYLISIIIVINLISLTFFTASSIANAAEKAQVTPATTTEVKKDDKPAQASAATTTPPSTTTTPAAATTKPEEKKTETPVTTPSTTPSGSTTKTTEKFASWENFSDMNDNEDFTQMF